MNVLERICMSILAFQLPKRPEEKGAAMVEYALLVAGMAVVVAAAVLLFKGKIESLISGISL